MLDHAWRSEVIPQIPPFPKKKAYRIKTPKIEWISEERQLRIINAIPRDQRAIFLFLKYHYRRPSEACAMLKTDYDVFNQIFTIQRTLSSRKMVDSTKTDDEHPVPCHPEFLPWINECLNPKARPLTRRPEEVASSPFFFVNPLGWYKKGKRFSNDALNRIWRDACHKVGEDIDLYSGLKHSSCTQAFVEHGMSKSEIQTLTGHKRIDSVDKYTGGNIEKQKALQSRMSKPEIVRPKKARKEE